MTPLTVLILPLMFPLGYDPKQKRTDATKTSVLLRRFRA